jgi:hypothetical protein
MTDKPMTGADYRRNPEAAAQRVKHLLGGRSIWITQSGADTRPSIKIECEDLELLHAIDDFMMACVRYHQI